MNPNLISDGLENCMRIVYLDDDDDYPPREPSESEIFYEKLCKLADHPSEAYRKERLMGLCYNDQEFQDRLLRAFLDSIIYEKAFEDFMISYQRLYKEGKECRCMGGCACDGHCGCRRKCYCSYRLEEIYYPFDHPPTELQVKTVERVHRENNEVIKASRSYLISIKNQAIERFQFTGFKQADEIRGGSTLSLKVPMLHKVVGLRTAFKLCEMWTDTYKVCTIKEFCDNNPSVLCLKPMEDYRCYRKHMDEDAGIDEIRYIDERPRLKPIPLFEEYHIMRQRENPISRDEYMKREEFVRKEFDNFLEHLIKKAD